MAIQLSVVSPVYRGERLVQPLVERIRAAVAPLQVAYEIVLVEDGSPDASWAAIERMAALHPEVVGIELSRNFGQHPAITAGLAHARGEWVVVMDCDLQDRPEEITSLWQHAHAQGLDAVQAQRVMRQDGWLKRTFSWTFYAFLTWLTGADHDPSVANFGLYHRRVVDAILALPERIRYFPTMVQWVGYRRGKMPVQHDARLEGKTSYNWAALTRLALNIILSYSDKPLRLAVKLGMGISFVALAFAGVVLVRALLGQYIVSGYASLMVSIWFLSGLIISVLGVVGLYVGKTFEGVRQRPIFIVRSLRYRASDSAQG